MVELVMVISPIHRDFELRAVLIVIGVIEPVVLCSWPLISGERSIRDVFQSRVRSWRCHHNRLSPSL